MSLSKPGRSRLAALVVVLAAATSAGRAPAQSLPPASVPIDSLAQAFADAHSVPSLVVGVSVRGERTVAGVGEVRGAAPDARTIYEIGSVSKVLTALALADGVARGEVALETPAAELLPGWAVGAHPDGPVRLVDLATHTSGLPKLPLDLLWSADPLDPYAGYGPDRMRAFLASVTPMTPPGETYLYSNAGAGLLGFALARRADTSYGALVTERVLAPLGMTDTVLDVAPADTSRFARAVGPEGSPAQHWTFQDTFAGAGAWRSTTADLLTLAESALRPSATPLGDALALSLAPRADVPGGQIGLGWHLNEIAGETMAWHNGMVGGAASFVGIAPASGVAVVVLTNSTTPLDPLAAQIAYRLLTAE